MIPGGLAGTATPSWRRDAALLVALTAGTAAPAWSQAFHHDSNLPIEITADRLEVTQDDQVATFLGNVDAVQGELVLSSDELRVFYRASEGAPGVNSGSIRRIEAQGNVFLSSPEENAQGEFGVYDVDGALLTLEGSVVLTRDDNVVRGQRLEIDLVTGRSQMFSAVPSTAGGEAGERVRAVFVPPPEQVEPAAGPSADGAGSSGGGTPPATPPRKPAE